MTHDNIIADYQRYKRQAIKWARIALDNHKAGLPWRDAAQQAREYFNWVNTLIKQGEHTMRKYIQFLSLSTGYIPGTIPPQFGVLRKPIEMLGSDGIYPLDGRWCSATVHRKAREIGMLRKAVGYRLCHGLTSNGWTQQSRDFLLGSPSCTT